LLLLLSVVVLLLLVGVVMATGGVERAFASSSGRNVSAALAVCPAGLTKARSRTVMAWG
jgi:hypothetical protein